MPHVWRFYLFVILILPQVILTCNKYMWLLNPFSVGGLAMSEKYKKDEFIYFIEEHSGKFEEIRAKNGSTRKKPITTKREISFDDIDQLDLEQRGEQVPFTSRHVVNTPLYFINYWSPVIGDRACWLYIQLLSYCREDRDFLWDKLEEIAYRMKITRPTLNKLLEILELYNFIIKVHRLNKEENNRQTSPLIKVRQTIPLLSKEQYNMLSEKGKKHHDNFMEKYGKRTTMSQFSYDAQQTFDDLLANSEVRISKKTKRKMDDIIQEDKARSYILIKLNSIGNESQKQWHDKLNNPSVMSKPMYDSAFKDSIVHYNKKGIVEIICSLLAKTFIESNKKSFDKKFQSVVEDMFNLNGKKYEIKYYDFEQYISILEEG